MNAKQAVEALFAMGPFGWTIVVLAFMVAMWQLKKEYSEGNFASTVTIGFAALMLVSVLITGAVMLMAKSRIQNVSGRADTKIGIEQKEKR